MTDMDQVAVNRFSDALAIQAGASNPSGVARALVRAINQCNKENVGAREDAAVRLIVHQLAYLCGIYEIDHTSDVYGVLTRECEEKAAENRS